MADSEVRQKFEDPCTAQLKREAREKRALLQDVYDEGFSAGMRAGEIAMKEKAANRASDLWESDGNPCASPVCAEIPAAIRALPLSGAEESKR